MNDKEFLSVAEFAELAGVSRQAVYKQLSTKLKDFVNLVDNKKYINRKGLGVFESTETVNHSTKCKPNVNQAEQPSERDFLIKQIEEKDKQIVFLQSEVERLGKLLENQQVLLLNEQQKNAALLPEETEIKKGFLKKLFKR